MNINKLFVLLIIICFTNVSIVAQNIESSIIPKVTNKDTNTIAEPKEKTISIIKNRESALTIPISYKGEIMSNLDGGIAKGTEYLGYGTIGIGFDTEKAKIWKGGLFYIEGATTHGGTPSLDYIGDAQIASNIEAGNHIYLQRLHLQQQIGNFYTKIGLLDLNDDFAVCESALLFHNSSFGIHSVLSYNFSAPIFPVTGLGFMAAYDVNDKWKILVGLYDGGPIQFDDGNPYNVNWELNINKGYLATTEVQFKIKESCYCLNGFYHTGLQRYGLSLSVDQHILESNFHKLNGFLYAALGDKKQGRIIDYNINAGLKLDGVFSRKRRDSAGIAIAMSCFLDSYVEKAIELVYSYKISSWFSIEPDLQYIINPLYDDLIFKRDNALVASLRFVISI